MLVIFGFQYFRKLLSKQQQTYPILLNRGLYIGFFKYNLQGLKG